MVREGSRDHCAFVCRVELSVHGLLDPEHEQTVVLQKNGKCSPSDSLTFRMTSILICAAVKTSNIVRGGVNVFMYVLRCCQPP